MPKKNVPRLPLAERLTFKIHRIAARVALIGSHHFEELGLNHYSARILVMLRELGEVRAGQLTELMLQPQSTISTQLRALQKRKLIRRRRSPQDNRAVIVTLTEEGRNVADNCDALSLRVQAALARGMTEEEARNGYAFLEKIEQLLNHIEAEEVTHSSPARDGEAA